MIKPLFLAEIIYILYCSIGNAQIIYSNAFNGGAVDINGTVPTMATNIAGGMSSATWNSVYDNATSYMKKNGTVGAAANSVLLPFAPQSGYVYTLTVSITFTSDPGNWLAMGFGSYNPASNTALDPRFNVGYVKGNPWSLFRPGTGNGGVNLEFAYNGLVGSSALISTTFPNTNTISIILDTTGINWIISEFANGTQVGTNYPYANIPSIGAIGVGQTTVSSSAGIKWNYLSLTATGTGPATNTITATVSFSPTNTGAPLNPSFDGLSYEKNAIIGNYFNSNNVPLVKLYSLIGSPAVLRLGGGTVDQSGWNGIPGTPITSSQVDRLAGFMKALPGNWKVIYGINYVSNTPANAAAEALYAANALGTNLLGFEIGNEPEYYPNFSYSSFLSRFRSIAAAITNAVPGWAVTNGGNGWIFADADAGQGQLAAITDKFAKDESGVVSLLTQHYYRAGPSPTNTLQFLLQRDTQILFPLITNIVGAANGHQSLGARITETASFSAGGMQGVSDVYGAALWSLDFMFTVALNGGAGVNFHGGWISPYSPLIDNGTNVMRVGPEFYGLKMFSLLPQGNVIPATITPTPSINFTAYGLRQTNIGISVLLNNKDTTNTVMVNVNLGTNVIGAQLIRLTGPSLYSASCYTLGGAIINPADGTWKGGVQAVLPATNGLVTVSVPPISAVLLNPVVAPPPITSSVNGNQLTLSWPTNYTGWFLRSNPVGLTTTNWSLVLGSNNTNRVPITIQPRQTNVFFRLSSQ